MKHFLFPALTSLVLTLTMSSCEKKDKDPDCDLPLYEPVTAAALTQTSTWYLSAYSASGQTTEGGLIKDRFALSFAPDGSYRRILLSDNSETAGTWKLTAPDNRQLNLIDHKGDPQDFTVDGVTTEYLQFHRPDKTGQPEIYIFKTVR